MKLKQHELGYLNNRIVEMDLLRKMISRGRFELGMPKWFTASDFSTLSSNLMHKITDLESFEVSSFLTGRCPIIGHVRKNVEDGWVTPNDIQIINEFYESFSRTVNDKWDRMVQLKKEREAEKREDNINDSEKVGEMEVVKMPGGYIAVKDADEWQYSHEYDNETIDEIIKNISNRFNEW